MSDRVLDERGDPDEEDPSGRLSAYLAKTRTPLDVLALLTLWLVVVPPGDFGGSAASWVFAARLAISCVYGLDMLIRARMATRHLRYLRDHPIGVLSVPFPPVRVIFSLRLVRSVFRRGNLGRFLVAAATLVLNGAVIVALYERHAPGSNIHTFGQSIWWAFVTVTTVGYGDYTPVTPAGRVTAVFIMATGILTLAVVTAQVSSSFVDQTRLRREAAAQQQPLSEERLAQLDRRLARIEELLTAALPPTAPGPEPGDG